MTGNANIQLKSGKMISSIKGVVGVKRETLHVSPDFAAGCIDPLVQLIFFDRLFKAPISLFISDIHALARSIIHIKIYLFIVPLFVQKPIFLAAI
jgi:hypothetical protein